MVLDPIPPPLSRSNILSTYIYMYIRYTCACVYPNASYTKSYVKTYTCKWLWLYKSISKDTHEYIHTPEQEQHSEWNWLLLQIVWHFFTHAYVYVFLYAMLRGIFVCLCVSRGSIIIRSAQIYTYQHPTEYVYMFIFYIHMSLFATKEHPGYVYIFIYIKIYIYTYISYIYIYEYLRVCTYTQYIRTCTKSF